MEQKQSGHQMLGKWEASKQGTQRRCEDWETWAAGGDSGDCEGPACAHPLGPYPGNTRVYPRY